MKIVVLLFMQSEYPDGARTRAVSVIRWLAIGVRPAKRKPQTKGKGRPGELRTQWETMCVQVCPVCSKTRGPEGRFKTQAWFTRLRGVAGRNRFGV